MPRRVQALDKNAIVDFVFETAPVGIIIFDQGLRPVYSTTSAKKFLARYELPGEITGISKRIFGAIEQSRLNEICPGEICFSRKFDASENIFTFRFRICKDPKPFVAVFVFEESISQKVDLNKIRGQFNLTRREIDILKCVIDGLKNGDIAGSLEISEQTVKDHLSRIYMKLGVKNRFETVRFLIGSSTSNFAQ